MHKGALRTGGVLFMALAAVLFGQRIGNVAYRNPELPAEKRAAELVAQMTLEEKVLQMQNSLRRWLGAHRHRPLLRRGSRGCARNRRPGGDPAALPDAQAAWRNRHS